jgi:adenylate cyclase class 2
LSHLEIEIKFWVQDPAELKRRIAALGATSRGPVFETNVRYENAAGTLARDGCLLRLRKDSGARLTFKSPSEADDREFKVHRELEVHVGDFETMHLILGSLGFRSVQIYEKNRETFAVDGAELCLDELPFGRFLEIEGPKERIRYLAERLDLPWDRRIVMNYLQMFEIVKGRLNLDFNDIKFENFKNLTVRTDALAPLFEARGA